MSAFAIVVHKAADPSCPCSLCAKTRADQIGPEDTLGYLKRLFLPGDSVLIQGIHSTRAGDVFDHTDTLEAALEPNTVTSIAEQQGAGYNVFVCMNPVNPETKKRTKENIASIRSVYIDIDANGDDTRQEIKASVAANEIPAPHFILQSSPGKYHIVWLVEGFTLPAQEALNKTLQQRFGADPAATDATRVLRLPGTRNLKYEAQPVCEIVEQNPGRRSTPADFKLAASNLAVCTASGEPEQKVTEQELNAPVLEGTIQTWMARIAGWLRQTKDFTPDQIFEELVRRLRMQAYAKGRSNPVRRSTRSRQSPPGGGFHREKTVWLREARARDTYRQRQD